MRGGSLSHPDVVAALRPFILASWSGRPDKMPADVREIWAEARPGGRNISCMVIDPKGRLVRAFWPLPEFERPGRGGGDPFDRDRLGRFMKEEIERSKSGLMLPEAKPRGALALPEPKGPGVRVFLTLTTAARGPANYRAPAVEAVSTTDVERSALAIPVQPRSVAATSLRRWLEQLYPPAIMDSTGRPPTVEGTLSLSPAGKRQAILKGEVRFQMDDRAGTRYSGTLEAVATYSESGAMEKFVGVFEGMFPKPGRGGDPLEYRMVGLVESAP